MRIDEGAYTLVNVLYILPILSTNPIIMKLTIDLPDTLTVEKITQVIKDIERILTKEGINSDIQQKSTRPEIDPWDQVNFSEIAVDAGIEDFAENHIINKMHHKTIYCRIRDEPNSNM